jgi:hypothetical protein
MIHFQYQQFLTLLLLLAIAKFTAYVYLDWIEIVSILFIVFLIEHLFIYLKSKEVAYLSFSALSTALGVVLMLSSPHLWIYILLITVGLIQKHFLQLEGKHLFNPSNFALIIGLLFFYHDAHIVLGQLGDERWVQGVVIVLAIAILVRVERWLIPLIFVPIYLLLQYIIIVNTDPMLIMEDIYLRFYSVSFILFILFMLTDPKTTPSSWISQGSFAITIALGATLLDYQYGFRVQHLFLSLFLNSFVWIAGVGMKKNAFSRVVYLQLLLLLVLVLSAIIYIELQTPYYLEMNG